MKTIKLFLILFFLYCTDSWALSGFSYEGKITIDKIKIKADVSDFTVALTSFPDAFYSACKADGTDITVTQSDQTTKIDRKINGFSKTNKTLVLKFKAPSLSTTSNSIFYIFAGKSSASESNVNPYKSSYKTVYECEDTPSGSNSVLDDTNALNMTSTNMDSNNLVSGKIGKSYDLNGTDERCNSPERPSTATAGSIYLWFNADAIPNGSIAQQRIFGYDVYDDTNGVRTYLQLGFYKYQRIVAFKRNNGDGNSAYYGATTTITNGNWYFIVLRSNDTSWSLRVNTTNQTYTQEPDYYLGNDNGQWFGDLVYRTYRNLNIGTYSTPNTTPVFYYNGRIDYVHITDDQVSDNDLETIYNMTNDNSTFYSITDQSATATTLKKMLIIE